MCAGGWQQKILVEELEYQWELVKEYDLRNPSHGMFPGLVGGPIMSQQMMMQQQPGGQQQQPMMMMMPPPNPNQQGQAQPMMVYQGQPGVQQGQQPGVQMGVPSQGQPIQGQPVQQGAQGQPPVMPGMVSDGQVVQQQPSQSNPMFQSFLDELAATQFQSDKKQKISEWLQRPNNKVNCGELEVLFTQHVSLLYREQLLIEVGYQCVFDPQNLHNTVAHIMERDPSAPSVATLCKQMGLS